MMTFKKILLFVCCFSFYCAFAQHKQTDRQLWISYLDKIARPVLSNLAENSLKEKMVVELSKRVTDREGRQQASYLEAFGRILSGIAP